MKKNILFFPLIVVIVIAAAYAYRIFYANQATNTVLQIQSERENPQILFPVAGGTLYKGHTYNIQWTGGKQGEVLFLSNVVLQKEGMSASLLDRVYDIISTNNVQYTIPANIPDGTYTISIAGLTSGEFQITSRD